ncbi:hypothetical protein PM082_009848 [Marasmius tenuissimus]|nr:hypothetical protein PM082_009848 [Marasmius tenuissimus]
MLFSVLCKYSEASVVLVFVFGGPHSPQFKQGQKHRTIAESLRCDAIKLICHFGYYSTEVEGEADGYLASLSHLRVVDGVISEDEDLLALGVDIVLRQPRNNSMDELVYDVYSAKWIKEDTCLEQEGIILVALLCDIHVGVKGCDIETAVHLARSGLGKELVHTFKQLSQQRKLLQQYIRSWRAKVTNEFLFNTSDYLERRLPNVAACIDEHFPSLELLGYYVNSPTQLPLEDVKYMNRSFRPTLPKVAGIVSFCRERFQWSDADITCRFELGLFKGAIGRMLHSPLVVFSNQEQTFYERTWKVKLLKENPQYRIEEDIEEVKATFSLAGLLKVAGLPVMRPMKEAMWIPLAVLRTAKLPRGLSQARYNAAASGIPAPVVDGNLV